MGMGVSSQGDGKADPQEGIWDQGSVCSLQEQSQEAGPLSRLCLHVSLGTMSTFLSLSPHLESKMDQIVRVALFQP